MELIEVIARRGMATLVVTLAMATVACVSPLGAAVDPGHLDFVVFKDPGSGFETADVRDVDGEIVRFDAGREQLFWVASSFAFDGFDIDGTKLSEGFFTVRFGSENGVRQAYFTETDPPTICDLEVTGGALEITPTQVAVPQQ
jgi:hypothetical protein